MNNRIRKLFNHKLVSNPRPSHEHTYAKIIIERHDTCMSVGEVIIPRKIDNQPFYYEDIFVAVRDALKIVGSDITAMMLHEAADKADVRRFTSWEIEMIRDNLPPELVEKERNEERNNERTRPTMDAQLKAMRNSIEATEKAEQKHVQHITPNAADSKHMTEEEWIKLYNEDISEGAMLERIRELEDEAENAREAIATLSKRLDNQNQRLIEMSPLVIAENKFTDSDMIKEAKKPIPCTIPKRKPKSRSKVAFGAELQNDDTLTTKDILPQAQTVAIDGNRKKR